jgi:hypothetical protein
MVAMQCKKQNSTICVSLATMGLMALIMGEQSSFHDGFSVH